MWRWMANSARRQRTRSACALLSMRAGTIRRCLPLWHLPDFITICSFWLIESAPFFFDAALGAISQGPV